MVARFALCVLCVPDIRGTKRAKLVNGLGNDPRGPKRQFYRLPRLLSGLTIHIESSRVVATRRRMTYAPSRP